MIVSNANLFCSYNVISKLLTKFGLTMEHGKTDVFHFSRSHGSFNPPSLDLTSLGGTVLRPKTTWHYLGFLFNHKLLFHQHIDFYANKAISTIKCMKMLGNSLRGLDPIQKRHLYRCYTLTIALYGFQLWHYNKVPLAYPLEKLGKIQRRAAIWITGMFHTSPTVGVEAIAGLIPIYLHLQKLYGCFLLQAH